LKEVYEKVSSGGDSVAVPDLKQALNDAEIQKFISLSAGDVNSIWGKVEGDGKASLSPAEFISYFGK